MEWLRAYVRSALFRLRPLAPAVWWSWGISLAFLLLYIVIAAGAPRAVEACSQSLAQRPMSALLAGLLGLSGLAPFAFVLTVSVAGIAVVPSFAVSAALERTSGRSRKAWGA